MWLNRRSDWEDTQLFRASRQVESDKHHNYFPLSLTWAGASEASSMREIDTQWISFSLKNGMSSAGRGQRPETHACPSPGGLCAYVLRFEEIIRYLFCWLGAGAGAQCESIRDNVFTKQVTKPHHSHSNQQCCTLAAASYFCCAGKLLQPNFFFSVSLKLFYFANVTLMMTLMLNWTVLNVKHVIKTGKTRKQRLLWQVCGQVM